MTSSSHSQYRHTLRPCLLSIVFATLATTALTASASEQSTAPDPLAPARALAEAFNKVSAAAQSSVVHIHVSGGKIPDRRIKQIAARLREANPWGDYFSLESKLSIIDMAPGTGSGLVLDSEGLLLTNYHVVEARPQIKVTLPDGHDVDAKMIIADHMMDLALLKIPPTSGLVPARFGDSDQLKVGDWVIVVGAPFGLTHTSTHGMVSALAREGVEGMPAATYQHFIQTDAPIHPGNSGGPMLNLDGQIVGIVTAQAPLSDAVSAGIGFAIPSNRVRTAIEKLKKGEIEHGWLGIVAVDLTDTDAEVYRVRDDRGVLATAIYQGTNAEKAGVQVDDVIVSVESSPVHNRAQLQNQLADRDPGQKVTLGIIRDGQRKNISVELEKTPRGSLDSLYKTISERRIPQLQWRVRTLRSGMCQTMHREYNTFGEQTGQREYDVRGVRILLPSSSSSFGETIVKCEGKPIRSVADLLEVLREHKPGDKVEVEFHKSDTATTKSELVIAGTDTEPAD